MMDSDRFVARQVRALRRLGKQEAKAAPRVAQARIAIVANVDSPPGTFAVYLDHPTLPSPGFRYQADRQPKPGDLVRCWLTPDGDRWGETIERDYRQRGEEFPADPRDHDPFHMMDSHIDYIYDEGLGLWLSAQIFTLVIPVTDALLPLSANNSAWARVRIPWTPEQDIYLLTFWSAAHILTPNSGASYWTVDLRKESPATVVASYTTAADTVATWTMHDVAINALLGKTFYGFSMRSTKTGTPGDAYFLNSITYRLVG